MYRNRRELLENAIKKLTLPEMRIFGRELFRIDVHSLAVWIYGKGVSYSLFLSLFLARALSL